MGRAPDVAAVVRRFLQARRRGPLVDRELTRLLDRDAVFTEIVGATAVRISGSAAIAAHIREVWNRRGDDARMTVLRCKAAGAERAVGHWRLELSDGRVWHGRDSYRLRDGRIVAVEAEHVDVASVPRYFRPATRAS